MSLHQMQSKTRMVVKAPTLSSRKPRAKAFFFLPIHFYQTKAKDGIIFTEFGLELLHFSGMQIFSLWFCRVTRNTC